MLRNRFPEIIAELPAKMDAVASEGADMVVLGAKTRVHVGLSDPHLRDAIHKEREGLGRYAVVAGDTEVFYGHILEHGGAHSRPFPFLVPALEEARGPVEKLALAAVRAL